MNTEGMLAPFAEEELHRFQGQGGKWLTYIEDETVMDRLDVGYGMGNWSIRTEAVPYVEGAVKVILSVRSRDEWVAYEDFGYPNNKGGGQELKEAVSDGIRRCGRYVGIARDLYRKDENTRAAAPTGRPAPPQRPVTPARPHVVNTDVEEPDDLAELFGGPAGSTPAGFVAGSLQAHVDGVTQRDDLTTCPIHEVPWAGAIGDLWHKDPEGRYCRHPDNVKRARAAR